MIEYASGNLLEADAEAVVNTVNTAGVMGKGVALQFKQAFPGNYQAYRAAWKRGEIQPGRMFVYETDSYTNPRYIINFPTKRHWRGKARLADIEAGLTDLVEQVRARRIQSVALPPLGCGNGGLDWREVRPRIEHALVAVPDVRVLVFEPDGAPTPDDMAVRTERPRMTAGRAALLGVMQQYSLLHERLTRLEVQKLAYFLQEAGEPLKLTFVKHRFGPYAEVINHVLLALEGHYTRGFGDRGGTSSLRLLPGATDDADIFLRDHPNTLARFERVAQLIEGFESPYGLELLATVHWVATKDPAARQEWEAALSAVHAWSPRKQRTFRPYHVQVAWTRLREHGWL